LKAQSQAFADRLAAIAGGARTARLARRRIAERGRTFPSWPGWSALDLIHCTCSHPDTREYAARHLGLLAVARVPW